MKEPQEGEAEGQSPSSHSSHQFMLRRLLDTEKYYLKVPNTRLCLHSSQYLFAQISTPNSHSSQHLSFNQDHNPYTPAFLPQNQQAPQEEPLESLKLQADPRQLRPKKRAPLKPQPHNKYCSVCHEHFDLYFKHINHPVHISNIAASQGQHYIQQLVSTVQRQAAKEEREEREQKASLMVPSLAKKRYLQAELELNTSQTSLPTRTQPKGGPRNYNHCLTDSFLQQSN